MLARREMPTEYYRWNKRWGVPNGRRQTTVGALGRLPESLGRTVLRGTALRRSRGPFAFQQNTTTRTYEYPWVYQQLSGLGPSRILDIGGALSGMQFVLAKDGHEVHNVDPFYDFGSGAYEIDPITEHATLNRVFDTNVVLHRSTLPEAGLTGQFDAAVCISTIEHFSPDDIESTLATVKQLLAPGGLLVLTIDLFLDLAPFCSRVTNVWGSNASVAWIDDLLGYAMVTGERSELNGYPEFSTDAILCRLEEFAMGVAYPQLAQLVTFRAPGG
jgi:2-polyprenyl-3-methyl-5-hydroxy-6-metoxy-1,4-benzoquinol methylase